MAKQIVNRGSTANDGTGDNLRDGANKVNLNFNEIYTAIGDGTTINGTIKIHDDSSTETIVSANGEVFKILGGTSITTAISGNNLTINLDTSSVVTATGTTTLTNKTVDLDANTLTGTLTEFNTALQGDSFVSLTGSETLTNKVLTTPTLTTPIANAGIQLKNGATSAGFLEFFEDSDNGTNKVTLIGPAATGDVTVTLPAAADTLVGKATTDTLTNKSIDSDNNTITNIVDADIKSSAAIANSKLANSTVTLGATSVALGATAASASNFSISGTSSLSGTGTVDTTGSGNKLRFNFANTGSLPTAATYEGMFAYDIGGNNPYVADAGGWVKLITENASIADISNVGSIASISNNQVLKWNASAGRFDPADDSGYVAGTDLDFASADVQDVGYVSHRSPDATVTQTLTVTVATKTTEHTAYGDGSSSGYLIDGHEGAHLNMSPGVYKFDQADSSNSGHPLLFYREAAKTTAYTTNVTTSGTPGSSGAHTTITITKDTPSTLHYQCSSHANMGGVLSNIGSEAPTIRMPDNDKIHFGDDNDAELYHSGSATILREAGAGDLFIAGNGVKITNGAMNENHVNCINNGSVSIYYDNVKKIETTTTGIDVTGEVLADKAYIAEATLTDQATVTWDMNSQSVCKLTLAGSRTMAAPTNGSTGQFASILVIQDGSGSRTLTWNAVYEFASDTAPTLTTTASLGDLFTFRYNGAKWLEVGRNQALTLS